MEWKVDSKFSVIIPVINELENLKILLPNITINDCEVLVCDNGSVDGSVEYAGSLKRVRVLPGTGTVVDAILRGISEASHDRIIVMDGDLSHPSDTAGEAAHLLNESDMVVGSRYLEWGRNRDTFINRVYSRGLNALTWMLAPKLTDRVSGLFGIRKELTKVKIRNTAKPMLEYLVRSNPTVVKEFPYIFNPRMRGDSVIGRSPKIIVKAFLDVVFLYFQKFNRFIKFCCIGGVGTLIVLALTYILTEFAGLWYMTSVIISAFVAAVWNFIMNRAWTFTQKTNSEDADYEWNAWYRGNPVQKWWKRSIGKVTKKFLGDPDSLLDIGCGSSPVINLFGGERVGVDGSQAKIDFISKHSSASFWTSNLNEEVAVQGNSFRGIICNNVLEHLGTPERVLSEIGRLLDTGGHAVITVPNSANPLTRLVEFVYGKLMPGGYADDHVITFTPKSLDKMCSKYGLVNRDQKSVATDMVVKYEKR